MLHDIWNRSKLRGAVVFADSNVLSVNRAIGLQSIEQTVYVADIFRQYGLIE